MLVGMLDGPGVDDVLVDELRSAVRERVEAELVDGRERGNKLRVTRTTKRKVLRAKGALRMTRQEKNRVIW